MNFSFRLVPIESLDSVWPAIAVGLERVKKRTRDATWQLVDVRRALDEGRAELHLGRAHDKYVGFVILAPTIDNYSLKKSLLTWVAYMPRVSQEIRDAADYAIGDIAWARGIDRGVFISARRGYKRRIPDGWREYETVYEKDYSKGRI